MEVTAIDGQDSLPHSTHQSVATAAAAPAAGAPAAAPVVTVTAAVSIRQTETSMRVAAPDAVHDTAAVDGAGNRKQAATGKLPTYITLTAEELVDRGMVPMKKGYVKINTGPKKVVEAVGGSAVQDAEGSAKAKSKKQFKKEQKQREQGQICNKFLSGYCPYGKQCRNSHDFEAYVRSKPADLPGNCPFAKAERCPFGVGCRWALSHTYADPIEQRLRDAAQALAGCSTDGLAVADGHSIQLLPVLDSLDRPINHLDKDVQAQLWKHRYDFSRADAVLNELGLRISFKQNRQLNVETTCTSVKVGSEARQPASVVSKVVQEEGTAATDLGEHAEDVASLEVAAIQCDAASAAVPEQPDTLVASAAHTHEPQAKKQRLDVPAVDGTNTLPGDGKSSVTPSAASSGDEKLESRKVYIEVPLRVEEKKTVDFRGKLYLAPLTTNGNLPFRRVCKLLGADITCGEMAMATNLLQGQASEWALLKRHPSEDIFGVQVCGGYPDAIARCCQLLDDTIDCSFVDINMGCPIDIVCDRGAGSALLRHPKRMEDIAKAASRAMHMPLTLKTRKGYYDHQDVTHTFAHNIPSWGACALTLHGRTRQQRYSKLADWDYIMEVGRSSPELQLIGNGDIFSYTDWNAHLGMDSPLATCMVARGALIKPWIFTEIKEQRHWDISSGERLDLLKKFASFGLEHWGSDARGVENTRKFLLEWLSFLHRYVPVGLLEVVPQQMHWRPPAYYGRNDLETLLASDSAADWVKISEMLLGPVPPGFSFVPKHKSNSYATSEADMAQAFDVDEQAQG